MSESDNLCYAITETLGCILGRDEQVHVIFVLFSENNVNLVDRVSLWWKPIDDNMLASSDAVAKVAFNAVVRLRNNRTVEEGKK